MRLMSIGVVVVGLAEAGLLALPTGLAVARLLSLPTVRTEAAA